MICQDWRDAPPEVVVPLYEAEGARWRHELWWDMSPSWAIVEEARAAGHLPGWLVRDGARGPIAGWSFFLLYAGTLQVGALNGTSARAIRELLQAIVRSPEAALARELSCFLFPASAAVQPALVRQRFALRQSLYLVNDDPGRVQGAGCKVQGAGCRVQGAEYKVRPFMLGDEPGVVRLLSLSYHGVPSAACFAPNGRREEWIHYVRQILTTPACGTLLREASFVADAPGIPDIGGAILTSRIGRDAAHIVQVAIDPALRRRGIGEALVSKACDAAHRAGYPRVTLLVDEQNVAARALYERLGFRTVSAFLFGTRKAIRAAVAA